ncbi:MAG: N-acetylmuramoyl-L-alanine amidase [Candidatus Hydrogenedentota bacterium]|nr:MAG: N-acetylmuramoyl-L-alanine amidase [Candidatus Hydrogenedentota bacterium]
MRLLSCLFFSVLLSKSIFAFTVVLDPGHGGRYISPKSVYGDKYDPLLHRYTDKFRPGAYYDGMWENEEVYEIAKLTKKILEDTQTLAGRRRFYRLLRKYGYPKRRNFRPIKVFLSRENSWHTRYMDIRDDVNAPYRLYDYPDIHTGQMQHGTVSRIHRFKPELVVTLHLTRGKPNSYGAMNAVITPSYYTYKKAIEYVRSSRKKRKTIRKKFMRSKWGDWFKTGKGRDSFEWFLCDAWIYFTGYWSTKSGLQPMKEKYRGYRHNMFDWAYKDPPGWEKSARKHRPYTQYSDHLRTFVPRGKFWQREKSKYERWRREKGYEGYGGDNLYASHELLRYVRKALLRHKVDTPKTLPEIRQPYISTWTVPTFVNAVSAYLELAYIDIPKDHQRILNYKHVYAEALAVGIYSLYYGIKQPKRNRKKNLPWGWAIHFAKYGRYFQSSVR